MTFLFRTRYAEMSRDPPDNLSASSVSKIRWFSYFARRFSYPSAKHAPRMASAKAMLPWRGWHILLPQSSLLAMPGSANKQASFAQLLANENYP